MGSPWVWCICEVIELLDMVVLLQKQHSYLHWFHLLTPLGVYKVFRPPPESMIVLSSKGSLVPFIKATFLEAGLAEIDFRFTGSGRGAGLPVSILLLRASSWRRLWTVLPEIVIPDLVLNRILCTVVQCSIKLRLESKVIVQDEQALLVLSWISDLGGLANVGSWTVTNGIMTSGVGWLTLTGEGFGVKGGGLGKLMGFRLLTGLP